MHINITLGLKKTPKKKKKCFDSIYWLDVFHTKVQLISNNFIEVGGWVMGRTVELAFYIDMFTL